MKSVVFLLLVTSFIGLPKYSQQTFWRHHKPSLPSDPNNVIYQRLQNIPSPQKTAQSFLTNFVLGYPAQAVRLGVVAKRVPPKEEHVIIVMDASGSIGSCEFKEGKKAMVKMMQLCPEKGPSYSCLYSAVSYSSLATVVFRYLPLARASPKMTKIHYPGRGTNTRAGLDEAAKIIQAGMRDRPFAERQVLLVTDGQSNDKKATINSAKNLKSIHAANVKISVVAVGKYIHGIDEMAKVASYPPEKHVYRVEKLSELKYVFELALKKMNRKYVAIKPPKSLCSRLGR